MNKAVTLGVSLLALVAVTVAAAATVKVVSTAHNARLHKGNGFRDVGVWRPVAVTRG